MSENESSRVAPVVGILYEFDVLYNKDRATMTDIAILRRAPGGVWEFFYYMPCTWGGSGLTQREGEPGEAFEERKEFAQEQRLVEAKARVQLHRWTARKEFLRAELPDHERVTRTPELGEVRTLEFRPEDRVDPFEVHTVEVRADEVVTEPHTPERIETRHSRPVPRDIPVAGYEGLPTRRVPLHKIKKGGPWS